jgi:hypothetical protein
MVMDTDPTKDAAFNAIFGKTAEVKNIAASLASLPLEQIGAALVSEHTQKLDVLKAIQAEEEQRHQAVIEKLTRLADAVDAIKPFLTTIAADIERNVEIISGKVTEDVNVFEGLTGVADEEVTP